jgi:hypothetical protein
MIVSNEYPPEEYEIMWYCGDEIMGVLLKRL